jgi:3D-(3,5/4)-trihydroxycyclohexane-1,2-dione acylhydrolase (decyclizing)
MVGDGSYLMMAQEIATSIQEGYKLNILVLDNHGFSSIGGLSGSLGSAGFGTEYRSRNPETGQLDGEVLAVDFAQNAASLGARVLKVGTRAELADAIQMAKTHDRTTVIVVETDREQRVPGYESWWDVAVAEVSTLEAVQAAREDYEKMRAEERNYL